MIRQPSITSSVSTNLTKIDNYINNLFDFGSTTSATIIENQLEQTTKSSGLALSSVGDVENVSENSTPRIEIDSLQESNDGSEVFSASTNVREAARVLDKFLKPDMIHIQQPTAQTGVNLAKMNNLRTAFVNEGNSLFKLVSLLDDHSVEINPDMGDSQNFVTYQNSKWNLQVFKQFLTPSEINFLLGSDRMFMKFIVLQILKDVHSKRPGQFSRLSPQEHNALLNLFYSRKINFENVKNVDDFSDKSELDAEFMKLALKMACDFKLYFALIYPVSGAVDEGGVSTVVTDIALSAKYLSMLSRRIDPTTSSRILDVVKSFEWREIEDIIVAGDQSVRVTVTNVGDFTLQCSQADLVADRLSAFTIESQSTVKFKAQCDWVPNDSSERPLVLRKNDIVFVIDAQPQDGLLYGSCQGHCGFFPVASVAPYDFSEIPLNLRRHYADRKIQDCDLIVDAGSLTGDHYESIEAWLRRGDADSRPREPNDNLAALVYRLSTRRQRYVLINSHYSTVNLNKKCGV